jgi:hypothetical protein
VLQIMKEHVKEYVAVRRRDHSSRITRISSSVDRPRCFR